MSARASLRLARTALACLMLGVAITLGCQAPTDAPPPGGAPASTPTAASSPTPVATATPEPESTPAPTLEPTPTAIPTPPTKATPTSTPAPTATPPAAPTPIPTRTPSATPTAVLTATPGPTAKPTAVRTPTPPPTPPPPKPTATYSNPQLGISFSYPEEWAIDATDPTLVRLTPGPGSTVAIQSNLTGPTSLESQLSQLLVDFSGGASFRDVARITPEGDVPRYVIEVEWEGGGGPVKGDFLVTVRGARVHSLGALAREDVYERHELEFKRMIGSFRTVAPSTGGAIDTGVEPLRLLEAIGDRARSIRGLPAPAEIRRQFQSREAFDAADQLVGETPASMARLKDLCLILDLCAAPDDLFQTLSDLTTEGVLGYYQPETKAVTLITSGERPDPLAWLTYAHEYTHALQDVRFSLSALGSAEDSFDASKALAALVEGDAKLVEDLFYETLSLEQQVQVEKALDRAIAEFSKSVQAAGIPRIISETFGWEHIAGSQLVFRLYLAGGFEAVNVAFQDPPRSTEQVLHPEKYLARELPLSVGLPELATALGATWQERDGGVLGELRTQVYLDGFLDSQQAAAAAAGWGGDRYALLKDDGGRLLIALRFLWDTPEDASQFFQSYLELADVKSQRRWETVQLEETTRLWVGDGISVHLSQEGAETLLVIGPDQETVSTVVQAALAATVGG